MAVEERWVGVDDVASHLGVAKDSVYRCIDEQGLPAHRVGRLFRFKLSEVDNWVRTGTSDDTDDSSTVGKKFDGNRARDTRLAITNWTFTRDGTTPIDLINGQELVERLVRLRKNRLIIGERKAMLTHLIQTPQVKKAMLRLPMI